MPHIGRSQNFLGKGAVLISHLSPDYDQAADELVVLFNPSVDTIDLIGHELRYFTSSGSVGSAGRSFDDVTMIPPGKHLLLASKDTVRVGSVDVLRDVSLSSGMATSGGQLVLRSSTEPDSIVYACAWGDISQFVAGMSDASEWNGDGIMTLVWEDSLYRRTGFNGSNSEYVHVQSDSVIYIPSLSGTLLQLDEYVWTIACFLTQGSHKDSSLVIGVADDATIGFDHAFDQPLPPPPPGMSLRAGVFRADLGLATGNHLLRDTRSFSVLADTTEQWYIDVWPAEAGIPLNIHLDVTGVPAHLPVQLRDLISGERQHRVGDLMSVVVTPQTTDPLRFLIVVGDTTPPRVHFLIPASDTAIIAGHEVSVLWSLTEASGIDSLSLKFYDGAKHVEYPVIDTTNVTVSIGWGLPPRLLTDSGSFHLFIRDSMGNHQVSYSGWVQVVPDTASILLASGWHTFSLPLEPAASQAVISSEDSIYAFGYHSGRGYIREDSLVPGGGYFIGVMTDREIRLPGIPPADTLTRVLQQGFSLVSTPIARQISKEDLQFEVDGVHYSYASALASSIIANGFYAYDHSSGLYVAADSLRPWNAYWLPVLVPSVSVTFPDVIAQASSRTTAFAKKGWEIRIHGRTDESHHSLFSIGIDPDASDGFDAAYDIPSPPSPPEEPDVQIFADRPEWKAPTGTRFLRDMRSGEVANTWSFTVHTSINVSTLMLSASCEGMAPQGIEIRDITDATGDWVALDEHWSRTINGNGKMKFKIRMTLSSSDLSGADVPREFHVSQGFPNPFNGSTSVTLAIPWRGVLGIRIYDVLGRIVAFNEEGEYLPGHHRWTWNTELSTGSYIGEAVLSSRTSGDREVRRWRMVLLK